NATGYTGPLEPVFARGQMTFGAAMLVGTLGGGLLGQLDLAAPYLVRAAVVVPLFALAWRGMPEPGFTRRALVLARVPAELRGVLRNFYVVVALYLVYGIALGVLMPVKQGYLNAHIPSAQRATIISLDSFFANLGGVAGQTGWGWLARMRSIADAWVAGGAALILGVPLYWVARRRDRVLDRF